MQFRKSWRVAGAMVCWLGVAAAQTPSEKIQVLRRSGQSARPAPAENFTGTASIEASFEASAPSRLYGARVRFAAGARSAWHTHARGQVLVVTEGRGRVQRWGDAVEEIRTGDIVLIPPGQKHWHGAAPDSAMTHAGIGEQGEGKGTEWSDPVSDAEYRAQPAGAASGTATGQKTAAQQLLGDVAPKLAELTDEVLFRDVWARPQLSPRDRSLVTVAALIAMNRPEQLRSHLRRALANGVTREEVVEAITQLAFYAGWPNAVMAVGVARGVFEEK